MTSQMARPALPDLNLSSFKRQFNVAKKRWEWWLKYGHEWFIYNAMPSTRMEEDFLGVFDLTAFGAGLGTVISETPLRAVVPAPGTGNFSALNILGGGMRMTTGGAIGNTAIIGAGDNTAFIYPWNVTRDVFFHAHFRLPTVDDLTNVALLAGLYADLNNYLCIRFDPTGAIAPPGIADPNLWFIARRAGAETRTNLGTPDNEWHTMWCRNRPGEVIAVFDERARTVHGSVPTLNLTHYAYLETRENVAKHFDFGHLIVLQDQT